MKTKRNFIKCPDCGRFIKKLDSMCPYCSAKIVGSEKEEIICSNCNKKIPVKNISPKNETNINIISHCPYCGVRIR